MSEATGTTGTTETLDELLSEFVRGTEKSMKTYGFAAGFLQCVLTQYFDRLPESAQKTLILQIENAIELYTVKES